MAKPIPKVRMPSQAKAGEIIEIKTLIAHEMEMGQRKDASGKVVPRKIINRFIASFNDKPVFEAEWFPSVSDQSVPVFLLQGGGERRIHLTWKDDDGSEYVNEEQAGRRLTASCT